MSIDPNNATPVYQQIAEHVRRSVAAGVHRAGEMIPSVRALALELTVNPNTVQRAYELLEQEGLILARKGLGMFVTQQATDSARGTSRQAVRDTFAHGIAIGQSAGMSSRRIRGAFSDAWNEICTDAERPA